MAPLPPLPTQATSNYRNANVPVRSVNPVQLSRSHALHYNPQDEALWQAISKRMSKPLPSLYVASSQEMHSRNNHATTPYTGTRVPQKISTVHRMEIPRVIISSSSEDAISPTYPVPVAGPPRLHKQPNARVGAAPPPPRASHNHANPHIHILKKSANKITHHNKPLPTLPPTSIVAIIDLMELMESEMVCEVQRVQESIRELRKDLGDYRAERRRAERQREESSMGHGGDDVEGGFWMVT